jgi:hypothetical protein
MNIIIFFSENQLMGQGLKDSIKVNIQLRKYRKYEIQLISGDNILAQTGIKIEELRPVTNQKIGRDTHFMLFNDKTWI